jgi:DNA-directed RNA polymerase subunit RPC12/RpoP
MVWYTKTKSMRPADIDTGAELYECTDCGNRVQEPETRVCETCNSKLKNISRPRDL